ncbi:MAG: hypothetical protein LBI17_01030 [Rickettsiales bacterium]|jgi:hypothetical protein|nr:hypothetical protein [Rickettsiales bacterium]
MRNALVILFAMLPFAALAAGDWCIYAEYKKKFPDCAETINIVDYNNCVIAKIAGACERAEAEVFDLLKKKMMAD